MTPEQNELYQTKLAAQRARNNEELQRRAERVGLNLLKLILSGETLSDEWMRRITRFVESPMEHARDMEELLIYRKARPR